MALHGRTGTNGDPRGLEIQDKKCAPELSPGHPLAVVLRRAASIVFSNGVTVLLVSYVVIVNVLNDVGVERLLHHRKSAETGEQLLFGCPDLCYCMSTTLSKLLEPLDISLKPTGDRRSNTRLPAGSKTRQLW